tara:strand:- start:113 stop:727 length:615 start_codon:yes stop_codon:yes gene_type:complete
MNTSDPRIDKYIDKSADFAKPILIHLRNLIHEVCPDVKETLKWSFPHFEHKGIICSITSFKQHCAFSFWKAALMEDPSGILRKGGSIAMGQFGKITKLSDLPKDEIIKELILQAIELNEKGIKLPVKTNTEKKELEIPEYFLESITSNPKAAETFENFSYTNKKEYVEWVTEAKTEKTRLKRLNTAIEWMSEGKVRNWKYIKNC